MAVTHAFGGRRPAGPSLYGVLSVLFVFILLLQLLRSIMLDAFSVVSTPLDMIGFAVCYAIGGLIILRAAVNRRLMTDLVILCGVLILYASVIVVTTSIDTSILAFLGPRFGILHWFLIGLGTAAAASYIHLPIGSYQARTQRHLFMLVAVVVGALLTLLSLTYLGYPTRTLSYQAVADNLILVILVFMIFTQVIWDGKVPFPVVIGLLTVGTLTVTAVAVMQSTSIVGFWIVGLIVYFWGALSKLPLRYKALAFATVIGAAVFYLSSDLFNKTLSKTRFAEVMEGGGLSSIDGRLALLSDFGRQFSVSPVFGNFSAEILAGSGVGGYPHTLLSFLTHTGLIGTTIASLVLVLIYSRRLPMRRLNLPDLQQLLFMTAILALGTLYTFMTWSPFWFMLGFMCKMPTHRLQGGRKTPSNSPLVDSDGF